MGSDIKPGHSFETEAKNTLAYGGVMRITSSAFRQEERIPIRYSCEGDDISPELTWVGAPSETAAFALILDDPDAHRTKWLYALYALQHSSQCHAHTRKYA